MTDVLFDPGFSRCMLGVSENVEFIYGAFSSSFMSPKQKKFQFTILYPKLKVLLHKNISFYLGCLLWAIYIKHIKDGIIENNPCFGNEFDEKVSLEEIDFLIDFVNKTLNRDTKYYLNQTYEPDIRHIKILETYREFLLKNKGFVKIKETKDIFMPKNVKTITKKITDIIKNKIYEAIEKKDLTLLYEVYDLILEQ